MRSTGNIILFFCLLIFFCSNAMAQPWSAVGNGLNGGVHGFAVYDSMLVMGGSFTNGGGGGGGPGGGGPGGGGGRIISWDSLNFNTAIPDTFGLLVRDIEVWNGDLIAVGDFWNQGQPCTGCNGVARWDGTAWHPLGTGVNNDVLTIAVYNGDLVIAGDFEACNGDTTIKRIARWDGTTWHGFDVDTFLSNDVRTVAVYDDELYIGGDFNNASGKGSADGIARWDEDDTLWKGVAKPGGIDSTVRALYVDEGKLYVGGHFRQILGDSSMSGIACWDGKNWTPLGTGVNSYVRAIHKYNGELYIGGDFTMADGKPASRIARWNGIEWRPCGGGVDSGYVRALQVYKGELYVGGAFKKYDGDKTDSPYIARWFSPPPPLVMKVDTSINASCHGACDGLAGITVGGGIRPYSYLWNDPQSQTTATVTGLCAGIFTVTVNDSEKQSSTVTITITEPGKVAVELLVTSDHNGSGLTCLGASDGELMVQAEGGTGNYTYRWEDIYWIHSPVATGLPAGNYSVTVTDDTECNGSASASLTGPEECPVEDTTEDLFIPSAFSPNADGTNDTWMIKGVSGVSVSVEIFNRWGEVLYRASSQSGNVTAWDGTYAGLSLPSAAYYYAVTIGEETHKGTVTIVR